MTTRTLLTTADLEAALANENHLGWGYAIRDDITDSSVVPPSRMASAERKLARLNDAVVEVANEAGLTAAELFDWTNSKWGRWLVDGVAGRTEKPNAETVRRYLSRKIIDDLAKGL